MWDTGTISRGFSSSSRFDKTTYDAKVRDPKTGRYRPAAAVQTGSHQLLLQVPGGLSSGIGQIVEVAILEPGARGSVVRRPQMVRALIRQVSTQGVRQVLLLRLFRPLRLSHAA